MRRQTKSTLKKVGDAIFTFFLVAVVIAAIVGLFLNEMALIDECMQHGHSRYYCNRILGW